MWTHEAKKVYVKELAMELEFKFWRQENMICNTSIFIHYLRFLGSMAYTSNEFVTGNPSKSLLSENQSIML